MTSAHIKQKTVGAMNLKINNATRINIVVRIIAGIFFCMYFSFLLYRLFFYAYGQYFRFFAGEISYNLIPFKTILNYLNNISLIDFDIWFFNLFGNVCAFMPMGFLLPVIFPKFQSFKAIATVTFLASFVLEIVQLWLRLGIADIDDVILNTFGGILGYFLFISFHKLVGQIITVKSKSR